MAEVKGLDSEMNESGAEEKAEGSVPAVDDVKGVGPSPTPNDVTGHAGRLQSAKEARNL